MTPRTVLATLRRLLRREGPAAGIVLMYHRVASVELDPWQLCVSPENFSSQLHALAAHWRIAPLAQLVASLERPTAPPTVAITFDDGYADNLHQALPLLRRAEAPATFFLTSGMLGSTHEFWWDELERLLLHERALPSKLEFPMGLRRHVIEPGKAAQASPDLRELVRSTQPWNAAPDTRLGCYYLVWNSLRSLSESERDAALVEIRHQIDQPHAPRDTHRTMTRNEVLSLSSCDFVDIGAHSVTHAAFSGLPADRQAAEMQQSKHELESLTGRAVAGLAYPYGDVGPESPSLAREAGFAFACTTEPGTVTRRSDAWRLPRVAVSDVPGHELVAELRSVLG
jgi:peptidoglycan/xylan/chitin deacetylase (PgdA/CDA1 family)